MSALAPIQQQDPALAILDQAVSSLINPDIVSGLPFEIDSSMLKRSRARLRVAFLAAGDPAKLIACSPRSVAKCIALSAMTGLYPGAPESHPDVWLIPRGGELCWQMGFRSYIRLARRAKYELTPGVVFKGETFAVSGGTSPEIIHEIDLEAERTWENIVHAYIIVESLQSGRIKVASLNKDEVAAHRAVAQTQNVWKSWPVPMTLKTMCNYAGGREMFPLDGGTRAAIAADNEAETGGLQTVKEKVARKQITALPTMGLAAVGAAVEQVSGPTSEISNGDQQLEAPKGGDPRGYDQRISEGFPALNRGDVIGILRGAKIFGEKESSFTPAMEDKTPWEEIEKALDGCSGTTKRG